MKTITRALAALLAGFSLVAVGCNNGVDNDSSDAATEDAATTVGYALGQENGGALDQMTDLSSMAGPGGFSTMATAQSGEVNALAKGAVPPQVDTSYNEATGVWTVSITRNRSDSSGEFTAQVTRVYNVQFLNVEGMPQRRWMVSNQSGGYDTARSITFTMVSGTGEHHTPRVDHYLTAISGSWTATGVNTDTLTINGSYSRSALDTITKGNAVRVLNHTTTLTLTDIRVPRVDHNGRLDLVWREASGAAAGTYHADVEFTRGETYREKTIDRTFNTTFSGGLAQMNFPGRGFRIALQRGEIGG